MTKLFQSMIKSKQKFEKTYGFYFLKTTVTYSFCSDIFFIWRNFYLLKIFEKKTQFICSIETESNLFKLEIARNLRQILGSCYQWRNHSISAFPKSTCQCEDFRIVVAFQRTCPLFRLNSFSNNPRRIESNQ